MMKRKLTFIVSAIMLINAVVGAQDFQQTYKMVALDSAIGDHFGQSVCISGNYAIIGADWSSKDEAGENIVYRAGSAYIFERDIDGYWSQVQKIVASDREENDHFGISVDISGNYAIVGALYENENANGEDTKNNAGSAYIFRRDEYGNWSQIQKIVASDRDELDYFGISVSISGNYAIIGAFVEDEDAAGGNTVADAGSAYIFEKQESGNWDEIDKIVAPDRDVDDRFGRSVAISGDYVIVGAEREDEDVSGENTLSTAGSAYIFKHNGEGNWEYVQKIVASDRAEGDFFAKTVSISGSYAIAGAYAKDDDSGGGTVYDVGSAYIFEKNGSENWNEVQKIMASDNDFADGFGNSVDISGDLAVVGASNDEKNAEGNDDVPYAGSTYIFKRNSSGIWEEIQKIVTSDRDTGDYFGHAVSISGDYIVTGAVYDDLNKKAEPTGDHGSAYVFETCSQNPVNNPENVVENGDFEICKLNPWSVSTWEGATASAVIVNGECKVSPFEIASEPLPWHIQLLQLLSEEQKEMIELGETYILSFDAYAETENRNFYVFLGDHDPPFTVLIDEPFTVGMETETFSFEFDFREVFPNTRLCFSVGAEMPAVAFDNVSLMKKTIPPEAINISNNTKIKIVPNPATDQLMVCAEEGSTVLVFDNLGKLLKTGIIKNGQAIFHIVDLTNGIYIVNVQKEDKVHIKKVLIQR